MNGLGMRLGDDRCGHKFRFVGGSEFVISTPTLASSPLPPTSPGGKAIPTLTFV